MQGDQLEIQWKLDTLRNVGDPEYLDYSEFFISSNKKKPLQLTNKKIKFLWRDTINNLGNIQLNKEISPIEKHTIEMREN